MARYQTKKNQKNTKHRVPVRKVSKQFQTNQSVVASGHAGKSRTVLGHLFGAVGKLPVAVLKFAKQFCIAFAGGNARRSEIYQQPIVKELCPELLQRLETFEKLVHSCSISIARLQDQLELVTLTKSSITSQQSLASPPPPLGALPIPPPPPPPPPPPLLPPPLHYARPVLQNLNNITSIPSKSKEQSLSQSSASRMCISVDDLRSIKLKKTPSVTRKEANVATSTPSVEALRSVRLRKTVVTFGKNAKSPSSPVKSPKYVMKQVPIRLPCSNLSGTPTMRRCLLVPDEVTPVLTRAMQKRLEIFNMSPEADKENDEAFD